MAMQTAYQLEEHVLLTLSLLRSSIHREAVEEELFVALSDEVWHALLDFAQEQAIGAFVAEQAMRLPSSCLPSPPLRYRLVKMVHDTQKSYEAVAQVFSLVAHAYQEMELPFVLLKGHSLGDLYSDGHLRASGDVDILFLREKDYHKANQWAQAKGYPLGQEGIYERVVTIDKIPVEHHSKLTDLGKEEYDKVIARATARLLGEGNHPRMEVIDGVEVQLLPHTLEGVYLFLHILHHFAYTGIGLKHLTDWGLYLSHYQEEIDTASFMRLADELDLLRPMRIFARALVEWLGFDRAIFPFDLDDTPNYSRVILDEVIRGGNFGYNIFAGKQFRSLWHRRWHMFRHTTKRSLTLGSISPEHIRTKPLVAIANRLRLWWG